MTKVTYSPLRYPGGKNKLAKYVEKLICVKKLNKSTYIEPFCGGAAVALHLLINEQVSDIIINDYDRSIFAFWYSVINYTDELCNLISNTNININEWHKQKKILENKENEDILTLGFSALFLNRTNRSGILKGGVIGGLNQDGNYKLDCRFNKISLINKIKTIAEFREKIQVYNLDTEVLIRNVINNLPKKCFIFFDPPYYKKGESLYTNFYKHQDHLSLANNIKSIKYHSWIVTYDNEIQIKDMYKGFEQNTYELNYSAQKKYIGKEVIIYSKTLSRNNFTDEFVI